MDLTSGAPFWVVRDGLPAVYPKLKQDRSCDVAIIGGGTPVRWWPIVSPMREFTSS